MHWIWSFYFQQWSVSCLWEVQHLCSVSTVLCCLSYKRWCLLRGSAELSGHVVRLIPWIFLILFLFLSLQVRIGTANPMSPPDTLSVFSFSSCLISIIVITFVAVPLFFSVIFIWLRKAWHCWVRTSLASEWQFFAQQWIMQLEKGRERGKISLESLL